MSIWDILDAIPRRGDVSPEELAARRQGYADLYAGGFLSRNSDQMPLSVQGAQAAQDFIPGIGDAIAFGEAGQALSEGDRRAAALLAAGGLIGVVPGVGNALARPIMAAGRKVADAIPSEALYAGRSLAEGDMRGVLDAFAPSRPAHGLGAEAVEASPAREVANLLSSGRANEVTDEMLAKFAPKDEMEMFDLYQRGATGMDLPMDEASRMARASHFSPALHGTGADITAVDPSFFGNGQDLLGTGFYTTTAPSRADRYVPKEKTSGIEASKEYAEGGNVIPLMVREDSPFMLDEPLGDAAKEIADIYADDPFFKVDRMSSGVNVVKDADGNSVMLDPYQQRHWALQNMRKAYGPQDTSGVLSEAGYSGVSGPESSGNRVRLAYDPSSIRSRFARFDPRLAHLRHLSAAIPAAGLLSTMMPQEEQY